MIPAEGDVKLPVTVKADTPVLSPVGCCTGVVIGADAPLIRLPPFVGTLFTIRPFPFPLNDPLPGLLPLMLMVLHPL